MRYLVFGDVHGNVEALDAVLAQAPRHGATAFLFVGDLVGYGPSPVECIRRLCELQQAGRLAWVAGNHDLAVRGDAEIERFTEEAVATLRWTRSLLESEPWAREFLAGGEVVTKVNVGIWLTHDSLAVPTSGGYHRTSQNAAGELNALRARRGKICFYGHTHALRAEVLVDTSKVVIAPMVTPPPNERDPHPLRLEPGELGWVGVGSAGFPTNPKRQPEYLVLDDEEWLVEKYTVDYPRDAVRTRTQQVLRAVCPQAVADRISRWL